MTYPRATTDESLTPFLFWNQMVAAADGAALACPQCTGPNLHLDTIRFAVPTDDHYTPTIGLILQRPFVTLSVVVR
jgi:hypothetical protein